MAVSCSLPSPGPQWLPEWLDSLRCLGQRRVAVCPRHSSAPCAGHRAAGSHPLGIPGHRDCRGVFVSLKLHSWESLWCPNKELQLCLGCGAPCLGERGCCRELGGDRPRSRSSASTCRLLLPGSKTPGCSIKASLSRTGCGYSLVCCPNPVQAHVGFCRQILILAGGGPMRSGLLSGHQEPQGCFYREVV